MKRGKILLAALLAVGVAGCRSDSAPGPQASAAASPPAAATVDSTIDPTTLVLNGRMPLEGVVTGGQPTDEQLEALRDAGFQTVINLRQPNESGTQDEAETVAELGMAYVSLPVAGAAGVTSENAAALAEALETAERPVLLHCGSGNRVGALLAMKALHVDGASPEDALALGLAGGVTRLEPVVREELGLAE